jgi:hypothetical protein
VNKSGLKQKISAKHDTIQTKPVLAWFGLNICLSPVKKLQASGIEESSRLHILGEAASNDGSQKKNIL